MSKRNFLLAVTVGLVATLFWVLPGQAAETIKMGYIGNFSWPVAADAFYAAQLAVDEINKAGGIQGRQVELLKEDSRGQTPMAAAAYKKLVMSKGAIMVMIAEGSEINFACQEAGADLYREYKHIAMNTCTSHEELGDKVKKNYNRYKFYFRPFLKTTSYFQFLKENIEAMNHYTKAKTMALIIEDALWTEYFRKGLPGKYRPFKEIVEGTGVKVVYYGETATGEKMFLPILDAIAAKKPDYIYNLNAYSDAVIFAKQWATSGAADIDYYNNGGASTMPAWWGMTGGAGLGVLSSTYSTKAFVTERTIPFIEAIKARYNKELNWVSNSSYDAVHLIKTATDLAKSTDVDAVIKSLEVQEMVGVAGKAKFDDTHTYIYGYPYQTAVRIQFQKGGTPVVTYPFDVAKATNPGKTFIPVKQLRKGQ
jgi:branched-chain amino acid transport system substrate-binding protein